MLVFHGSNINIDRIDLSRSEFFKDFGRGFYVTKIREHAYLRAIDVAKRYNTEKPIVTEFNYIETYPVTVGLNVKVFKKVSREWVEFVMLNRNRHISHPAHTYDIIEGPIANDNIVIQIRLYEQNRISIDELIERLTYSEPTHQICFCTIASLYALEQIENNDFNSVLDKTSDILLDKIVLDFKVTETEAIKILYPSMVYKHLSNAETQFYQKPWQEIYKILKEEIKDQL